MTKVKKEKSDSKVEVFRQLIRQGKTLQEAITATGVALNTARTQAYKVRKEKGIVKVRKSKETTIEPE